MKKILYALTFTILVTLACGTSNLAPAIAPTFDPNSLQTVIAGTALAAQSQTQTAYVPADTPMPTNTSLPTNIPLPTNTPLPLLPPTAIPQPQTYQGEGDKVVTLPSDSLGILHVVGNSASHYFGVEGYDGYNKKLSLLVNTTDIYDGRVLVNFSESGVVRLQVTAQGAWTITYYPIKSYDHYVTDLTIVGNNDDVWLSTLHIVPDKLQITGNQESRYFGVRVIGIDGADLAVNTTDPYSGEFLYSAKFGELMMIVITAQGKWQITIVPK